jgi:hypothetical protein
MKASDSSCLPESLLVQTEGLAAALGPDHVITTCLPESLLVQTPGAGGSTGS